MKNIQRILTFLACTPLFFSCAKEVAYEPGEPEDPNCEGVYFPTQTINGTFAPDSLHQFDIKVTRAKGDKEITVPLTVKCDSAELFLIPELQFESGQTEQTITVKFGKEIGKEFPKGKTFNLSLIIEDPAYASKYSSNASFISIPVLVESFKYLGKAEFNDGGLNYFASFGGKVIAPYEVDIYQNNMDPSQFRLIDPYKAGLEILLPLDIVAPGVKPAVSQFNFRIIKPGEVFNKGLVIKGTNYEFTVKGEDLVYFSDYYSGMNDGDDDIICYSPFDCTHYGLASSEADVAKNKVVNYQDPDADGNVLPAVVKLYPQFFPDNLSVGYWYGEHEMTIRFPGGEFVDYSLHITTSECVDGKSPVSFTLGKDIKSVKYAVYAGELTSKQIRQKSSLIGAGEETEAKTLNIAEPNIQIECKETGLYTIVAVGFDKTGTVQNNASAVFGYVKPGDEEDVQITFDAGLEQTPSRYFTEDISDVNSLLFYMVGTGITQVKYALYDSEKANVAEKLDSLKEDVKVNGATLNADDLELVNRQGGLCDLFIKLSPFTDYTLIVYGFNGFTGKVVTCSLSTSGLPLEKVGTGTYTYSLFFTGDDTDLDLMFDPNHGNVYQIEHWGYDVPLRFTQYNDSTIVVPMTYIGYDHDTYGPVYVQGLHGYIDDYAQEVADYYSIPISQALAVVFENMDVSEEEYKTSFSSFNSETGTYTFKVIYFVSGGSFGFGEEPFVLDGEAPVVESIAAKSCNGIISSSNFKANGMKRQLSKVNVAGIQAERDIQTAEIEVSAGEKIVPTKASLRKLFNK